MLDFKTVEETSTCVNCGVAYTDEIIFISGQKSFPNALKHCDKCASALRERLERENRVEIASSKFKELVPLSMRQTDITHSNFNSTLHEHSQKWIKAQIDNNSTRWFGVVGSTGRSKTRCISLMVKVLIWRGYSVRWCKAKNFQEASQSVWSSSRDLARESKRLLNEWKSCEVLVIDDIGKNKFTDNVESDLFDLLDHRSECAKMTIWSANTHPNEMMIKFKLSEDRGLPMIGRLLDFSDIVNV